MIAWFGLADAMHDALDYATDNLPEPTVDLGPHFLAMFATVEAAISELEDIAASHRAGA